MKYTLFIEGADGTPVKTLVSEDCQKILDGLMAWEQTPEAEHAHNYAKMIEIKKEFPLI